VILQAPFLTRTKIHMWTMIMKNSCVVWLAMGAISVVCAADSITVELERYRKMRGEVMARENDLFSKSLESALTLAKRQGNPTEVKRLESMLNQLTEDSKRLRGEGDLAALLPETADQLAIYLIGTRWSVDPKNAKEAREFTSDGQFKTKVDGVRFIALNGKKLTIMWSPTNKIDCEFSSDYRTFRELSGVGHTWHRQK
jgi:hypothetical protein